VWCAWCELRVPNQPPLEARGGWCSSNCHSAAPMWPLLIAVGKKSSRRA
jgi:hypothetical protein